MPWLVIIALSASPMEERMRDYFAGETNESFAFMGFGAASIGAGVPLFIQHDSIGRPASVPLMAFGLVQLVLGIGLFARTGRQVDELASQLAMSPARYKDEEGARMTRVMAGFQVYRAVELTVIATGGFMAGIGYVRGQQAVLGVGLGLLVEAASLLILDFFAETRGRAYAGFIADFVP